MTAKEKKMMKIPSADVLLKKCKSSTQVKGEIINTVARESNAADPVVTGVSRTKEIIASSYAMTTPSNNTSRATSIVCKPMGPNAYHATRPYVDVPSGGHFCSTIIISSLHWTSSSLMLASVIIPLYSFLMDDPVRRCREVRLLWRARSPWRC